MDKVVVVPPLTTDDDHAAAIVARTVGANADADKLEARAKNYHHLWNNVSGFMEARNADGSWAGEDEGWTEGDHWAYTLNVMVSLVGVWFGYSWNVTDVLGDPAFVLRQFQRGRFKATSETRTASNETTEPAFQNSL